MGTHHGHGHEVRRGRVEDRRPALGAEVERPGLPVVVHAPELARAAADPHPTRREARLRPERAAGPALTGELDEMRAL